MYRLHSYDMALVGLLRDIKSGFDKTHEVLGEIRNIPVMHGGSTRQVSEPTIVDSSMKKVTVDVLTDLDMYRTTNVDEFAVTLHKMWSSFAEDAVKEMFALLCQTTEATGNTIDGRDKNIWDAQIEMLETMEMSFDRDGNHGCKFYAHPDMYEKLRSVPQTDEQKERWEEAIKAKREQYDAKKRSRRLS